MLADDISARKLIDCLLTDNDILSMHLDAETGNVVNGLHGGDNRLVFIYLAREAHLAGCPDLVARVDVKLVSILSTITDGICKASIRSLADL